MSVHTRLVELIREFRHSPPSSSLTSLRKNSHSFSRSPSTAKLFTALQGQSDSSADKFCRCVLSGLHLSANVAPFSCSGGNSRPPGHSLWWSAPFPRTALIVLASLPRNLGQMQQALPDLDPITLCHFMPTKPSIWEIPTAQRDPIPPRDRQDHQIWPGYWIYHNRDHSISFGTAQRNDFGWLPAEITRAVPESVINTIASMVCHAHRMGRKEAHDYLKQFVLEQMRVPDLPHYPMNDLRKLTPPPLPPTPDK